MVDRESEIAVGEAQNAKQRAQVNRLDWEIRLVTRFSGGLAGLGGRRRAVGAVL